MDWSTWRVLEKALLTSVTPSSLHDYFPARTSAQLATFLWVQPLSDFAVSFLFLFFSALRKLQENNKKKCLL